MFHLQWHITERCNLCCTHCYKEEKMIKEEISTSQVFEILNKYYEQLEKWKFDKNSNRISFTGGEPFIREDFWKILDNCYNNREKVSYGILSNGTLLDEVVVSKLLDLQVEYVQVSLEGLEEINDQIRGKGSFFKAVRGLKLLVAHNIPCNISTTITSKNLKEVPRLIDLAKNIGVKNIGVRRLVPIGAGKKMQELMITPQENQELLRYILRENKKGGIYIGVGCEEGLFAQGMEYIPKGICNAGYFSFSVLPNADVYPCRRLPILCGNLLKNNFEQIMTLSKDLMNLRNFNNINKKCQSCPFFNECLGGAKCISNAYFNDPFAPDPQCLRLFKELPDPSEKFEGSNKKGVRIFKKNKKL
ncbi:MAG: radical SAM protein [Candidatus Pacebacteria bacterium]|nr:radical SAM protein [Candidatus Paceibacterota bacterium]